MNFNENDWEQAEEYWKGYDFVQLSSSRYCNLLNWFEHHSTGSQRILDFGCGTGNLTQKLLHKGKTVVAADINSFALKYLKEKCSSYLGKRLEIKDLNCNLIEPHSSFDLVTSMIVLPFPEDCKKYLSSSYQHLKKKGKLVLSSWAAVPDIYYGVIDLTEQELLQKGLQNSPYFPFWKTMKDSGESFAALIEEKGISLDILLSMLKEVGFQKTQVSESSYNGRYTYDLIAYK